MGYKSLRKNAPRFICSVLLDSRFSPFLFSDVIPLLVKKKKKDKEPPPNLSDGTLYHCNDTTVEERNLVVFPLQVLIYL